MSSHTSPKKVEPLAPLKIRQLVLRLVLFVVALCFAATPLFAWYADPSPTPRPVAETISPAERERLRVFDVLHADDRFRLVVPVGFVEPANFICLKGTVESEEDLFQLREQVSFIRSKIKIVWRVDVNETLFRNKVSREESGKEPPGGGLKN